VGTNWTNLNESINNYSIIENEHLPFSCFLRLAIELGVNLVFLILLISVLPGAVMWFQKNVGINAAIDQLYLWSRAP
jgi:ABC-type methionine transport system permease subunit